MISTWQFEDGSGKPVRIKERSSAYTMLEDASPQEFEWNSNSSSVGACFYMNGEDTKTSD